MQHPEAVLKGDVILAPPFEVTTPRLTVPAVFGDTTLKFCPDAEPGFLDTARQVFTGELYSQSQVSVYYTDEQGPLLLRKKADESSALTLQTFKWIGVETSSLAPPSSPELASGAMVQVSPETSVKRTESRRMARGWNLTMLRVDGPLVIRPGRSSPWGEEAGGRASRSMDYFRAAAIHAMTICELL
jgi:hypothetical protein